MSAAIRTTYYDSDQLRAPLSGAVANIRDYWGLLKLLVVRDLTVRYKRSALGVWWTLLNPLLTTAVLFLVFSQIFKAGADQLEVPFVVYLLSGVIVVTFFSQGVLAVGSSIVNSSSVLSKVYVPPEIFAVAAALAAGANFFISMVPLLLFQLVLGVGIPWTVLLTPLPILCLAALVTGVGLLVAAGAVYFYDVLDLTNIAIQLIGYLTPTFYTLSWVPERLRTVIFLNPVFSHLRVFRDLVYGGTFAPWWTFVAMIASAVVSLLLGTYTFSRSWKRLVVLL